MFLEAIRLGKSNSGQQFSKNCIGCSTIFEIRNGVVTPGNHTHFLCTNHKKRFKSIYAPLSFISNSGKLCEKCVKSRSKKPLVTDLRTCPETRPNGILDESLSILSTFTLAIRCYSQVP